MINSTVTQEVSWEAECLAFYLLFNQCAICFLNISGWLRTSKLITAFRDYLVLYLTFVPTVKHLFSLSDKCQGPIQVR